jgi:hypothetical protein
VITPAQRKQLRGAITHVSTVVGRTTVWKTYYQGRYIGDVWRAEGRRYRHWANSLRSQPGRPATVAFDNRLDASINLLGY